MNGYQKSKDADEKEVPSLVTTQGWAHPPQLWMILHEVIVLRRSESDGLVTQRDITATPEHLNMLYLSGANVVPHQHPQLPTSCLLVAE